VTAAGAIGAAFLAAVFGCGIYLKLARRWRLLDLPNERSAHAVPVPRGGGIGIFAGLYAGLLLLAAFGESLPPPYPGLLALATLLLAAGALDDRFGLPVRWRLPLYAMACAAAVWLLWGQQAPWLQLLAAVYALWILNLFNFMDGIDGIAASEAGFVFAAAALLSLWQGGEGAYPLLCLLLAAACLAFLHWNWSPARLFMGDAGSIPLGFLLAALSLEGEASGDLPLVCWLILLAVFIADATYTLLWRAVNGEKLATAHSRHCYQRLARHWRSHSRVVGAVTLYNLLWLMPCAAAALHWPQHSGWWLVLAYLPLLPFRVKADKLP
jgi:Fuc2NAc and GlcNAc transferase